MDDAIGPWRAFFELIGGAAATLTGLLFVAASVGSGFYTTDRQPALRIFLSPCIVHFTSVLLVALMIVVPWTGWAGLAALIEVLGFFGVAYAGVVLRNLAKLHAQRPLDWDDRLCYAAIPAAGYVAMAVAGALLPMHDARAFGLLAVAVCVLLVVSIRNVWDMTVWVLVRRSG